MSTLPDPTLPVEAPPSIEQQYSANYGRSTRRMKRLRREFREQCEERGEPCWLDGMPIDYSLPPEHPDAFSLDHALTVEARPDLAEDPGNFRASHLDCNKRRGTSDPALDLGDPSEEW